MKQIPMTDEELDVLIKLLTTVIPDKHDELLLYNLVNRLKVVRRMT